MPLITIHVRHEHHHAADADVVDVLNTLRHDYDCLKRKVNYLMKTAEEFRTAIKAIDTETTRIADKIDELMERLDAGGLTTEEEEEIHAELSGVTERLRAIGHDPNDPVPPE